jgi:hypothetical protein
MLSVTHEHSTAARLEPRRSPKGPDFWNPTGQWRSSEWSGSPRQCTGCGFRRGIGSCCPARTTTVWTRSSGRHWALPAGLYRNIAAALTATADPGDR